MAWNKRNVRQEPKTVIIPSPQHNEVMNQSSRYIMCMMKANKYLLKRINKSLTRQIKEFREGGIVIARSTVDNMGTGKYRSVYFNVLLYFSNYWNMSLFELYFIGDKLMKGEDVEHLV